MQGYRDLDPILEATGAKQEITQENRQPITGNTLKPYMTKHPVFMFSPTDITSLLHICSPEYSHEHICVPGFMMN